MWWLVTPGNPLKSDGPAPLARRMAAARAVMRHPQVEITDIEARLGTRFTAETLAALRARYPGVRFVWLMGADNLAAFVRSVTMMGGKQIEQKKAIDGDLLGIVFEDGSATTWSTSDGLGDRHSR